MNYLTDFVYPWKLTFQDPATMYAWQLINLHDYIMCIICFILGIVSWILITVLYRAWNFRLHYPIIKMGTLKINIFENEPLVRISNPTLMSWVEYLEYDGNIMSEWDDMTTVNRWLQITIFSRLLTILSTKAYVKYHPKKQNINLEILWTLFPGVILIAIAIPSLEVSYASENSLESIVGDGGVITIKIIGHQWYWSYEYMTLDSYVMFDSYMIQEQDLMIGGLRLLEVDEPLIVPSRTLIRLLITSDDVIHSWALPSAGIKVDAVPGRLNEIFLFLLRSGEFYGQCSELCGVNHAFMPIKVVAI